MESKSYLLETTISSIYIFIALFGFYIIYYGHISAGGGFQGGTVLAALFIVHYLITEDNSVSLEILTNIEKILYIAILCFAIIFGLYIGTSLPLYIKKIFLITMNTLIGVKVCCGLSVVFFRFVLFESR